MKYIYTFLIAGILSAVVYGIIKNKTNYTELPKDELAVLNADSTRYHKDLQRIYELIEEKYDLPSDSVKSISKYRYNRDYRTEFHDIYSDNSIKTNKDLINILIDLHQCFYRDSLHNFNPTLSGQLSRMVKFTDTNNYDHTVLVYFYDFGVLGYEGYLNITISDIAEELKGRVEFITENPDLACLP